jgi:hypothetical protein
MIINRLDRNALYTGALIDTTIKMARQTREGNMSPEYWRKQWPDGQALSIEPINRNREEKRSE